jgi:hypothetical protein
MTRVLLTGGFLLVIFSLLSLPPLWAAEYVSTPTPPPRASGPEIPFEYQVGSITLSHDDGLVDGFVTLRGAFGHLIRFTPPHEGMTANKILIYGKRTPNSRPDRNLTVQIWPVPLFSLYGGQKLESDRRPLYSVNVSYRVFSNVPQWVEIPIPETEFTDDFYVFVGTHSTSEDEVSIGYDYDSGGRALESEIGRLVGGTVWVEEWQLTYPHRGNAHWMIRVEGVKEPGGEAEGFLELKNDNGIRSQGIGQVGNKGFVERFDLPSTLQSLPMVVTQIRIHGKRKEGTEGFQFRVEIWDSDLNLLWGRTLPYERFSTEYRWVDIEVPDIRVRDRFYVFFHPGDPSGEKLLLGFDGTLTNYNTSNLAVPGRISYFFGSESAPIPRILTAETANWMIRANVQLLLLESPTPPPGTAPPATTAPTVEPTLPPVATLPHQTTAPPTTSPPSPAPFPPVCGPTLLLLLIPIPLWRRGRK